MKLNCTYNPNGLPILSKAQINEVAEEILHLYFPELLRDAKPLDLLRLMQEFLYIDLRTDILTKDGRILGMMSFRDQPFLVWREEKGFMPIDLPEGTMLIDARLKSIPSRLRFTEAHEVGHWILHRWLYSGIHMDYEFRKTGFSYVSDEKDPGEQSKKNPKQAHTDREWAEWQADTFAGALLMPQSVFVPQAEELLKTHGYSDLRLVSGVNVEDGIQVVGQLADIFQVSKRSVRIRMRGFGMYVDK